MINMINIDSKYCKYEYKGKEADIWSFRMIVLTIWKGDYIFEEEESWEDKIEKIENTIKYMPKEIRKIMKKCFKINSKERGRIEEIIEELKIIEQQYKEENQIEEEKERKPIPKMQNFMNIADLFKASQSYNICNLPNNCKDSNVSFISSISSISFISSISNSSNTSNILNNFHKANNETVKGEEKSRRSNKGLYILNNLYQSGTKNPNQLFNNLSYIKTFV